MPFPKFRLEEICLRSIMNGVENGTIEDVHDFVPRQLRQRLLDMVLEEYKIRNPIWIRELSSAKYLRGFTLTRGGVEGYTEFLSFNTQRGRWCDDEYLNSVAQSMESILENGETIGAGVEKLYLKSYWRRNMTNLGGLVRLIGRCTNLKSLNAYVNGESSTYRLLLNQVESQEECQPILENLEELSMTGYDSNILVTEYPIINFKRLTSLRLTGCRFDGGRWRELLNSVKETLTELRLVGVRASLDICLPIPLPRLEWFKIDNFSRGSSALFVENLQRCPKLKYVYVDLTRYDNLNEEDKERLKTLARIDDKLCKVEVKINISATTTLNAESKFETVAMFGEKIAELALGFDSQPWSRQLTNALENVVDSCQHLTSFTFWSPPSEIWLDRQNANAALIRLFGDRQRASRVRKVCLFGEIDFEVLMAIFENCLDLDSLEIESNDHLADAHLIRWAERGGRASSITFDNCRIGDEGVIPILINSADRLKQITIEEAQVTNRTWHTLINCCPNLESVNGMPPDL